MSRDDVRAAVKVIESELAALSVFEDICRCLALHPAPIAHGTCLLCNRTMRHCELEEHDFYCPWRRSREETFS